MKERILIVDDNSNNLRLLQSILEDEDYEVLSTSNSLEVLNIAIKENPDAILLDIMMPNLDGFAVCTQLKQQSETYGIPVIMVTAKTDVHDLKAAFDCGATDFIKKPIDEIELIARVKSALRQKHEQDRLKSLATKDGLTGLFNHCLLIEMFEKEFNQHQRNHPISFLMIDIDNFKQVNDTYGHMAGDMILSKVSEILTHATRSSDIVGRYGGEEFGIILPDTDASEAQLIGERIRTMTKEHLFDIGEKKINITLSCGIFSATVEDDITFTEALRCADEALYKAKHKGRDCVEIYE